MVFQKGESWFKYLHLWGALYPRHIPKDIWRHLFRIRSVEDWVLNGFRIKVDECMNVAPLNLGKIGFAFSWVNHIDNKMQYAIDQDKIYVRDPFDFYIFKTQGFTKEDFAPLEADLLFYLGAIESLFLGDYSQAEELLSRAIAATHDEWNAYEHLQEDISFARKGKKPLYHIYPIPEFKNK